MSKQRRLIGLVLGAVLMGSSPAHADGLDDIKARGTLIVGTKGDYRPFGFRDGSGAIVGFEPDLAADVARKLGVKLELTPVVTPDRIRLLTEHKLDVVIATMNATDERRKLIDFVEPSYYASGVNVLAPKSLHLHVWQELRGKPVCTVEGSFYISEIRDRYDAVIQTFNNTSAMYPALRDNKCVAVVYDDTAIIPAAEPRLAGLRDAAPLNPGGALGDGGRQGRDAPRSGAFGRGARVAPQRAHPGAGKALEHSALGLRRRDASQVSGRIALGRRGISPAWFTPRIANSNSPSPQRLMRH